MRHLTIAVALVVFGAAAYGDSLRSGAHLVKIDAQTLSETSRQYDVTVFEAQERTPLTRLQVRTRGDEPEEAETAAGGTLYKVRIQSHGEAYLVDFSAHDGNEVVDAMRGGFTRRTVSLVPPPAPVRTGRDIDAPAILRRVEAVYTEEARAAGAAGTVVLDVVIDRSGFVRNATVIKPMGYGLSEAAVEAVQQWHFATSTREQVPVEVLHEVTVEFKP